MSESPPALASAPTGATVAPGELAVVLALPREAGQLEALLAELERALGDLAWEAIVVVDAAPAPPIASALPRVRYVAGAEARAP